MEMEGDAQTDAAAAETGANQVLDRMEGGIGEDGSAEAGTAGNIQVSEVSDANAEEAEMAKKQLQGMAASAAANLAHIPPDSAARLVTVLLDSITMFSVPFSTSIPWSGVSWANVPGTKTHLFAPCLY
jgi:hypothetical protein